MSTYTNIRKEGEYLGCYQTPYDVWNVYPNPHEGSFMTVLDTLSVWMFKDGKWQNTNQGGGSSLVAGPHIGIENGIISIKATSQNIPNTIVQRDGYGSVDFNDVEVDTLSDNNDHSYAFPGSSDEIKEKADYILATLDDIKQAEGFTKEEADKLYQPKGDYAYQEDLSALDEAIIDLQNSLESGIKANAESIKAHAENAEIHITEEERAKWNSSHAEVDLSEYAKSADIASTYATKDSLQKEVADLSADIANKVDMDFFETIVESLDSSVKKNASDIKALQSTSLKIVFITQADYDAIATKSNQTCYAIVDGSTIKAMYTGAYKWDLCSCTENGGGDQDETIKMYYGYVEDETLLSYSDITSEHLSASTMTSAIPSTLGKTSLGINPQGCRILVVVPKSTGYVATKDNGIGGKVAFDESILGANGVAVTIDGVEYLVYGEFATIDGETFIYID